MASYFLNQDQNATPTAIGLACFTVFGDAPLIDYARVLTRDQSLKLQREAPTKDGWRDV